LWIWKRIEKAFGWLKAGWGKIQFCGVKGGV
jgi:hypothetical protein